MTVFASLLSDLPIEALAVRMFATAFVVMAVAWAVGVFGPIVGGALAGMPIILGPGFYFLIMKAPVAFVVQAASYSLLSLCATQLYLLAYIAAAGKAQPWLTLFGSITTWLLAAYLFQFFPVQPMTGVLLFVLATSVALILCRRFIVDEPTTKGTTGLGLLAFRGVLAGTLVAAVTTASHWLGPAGAGLLLAFPIGYSVVAVTIHQKLGAASVIATLYSALLGTASLAGFCSALAMTMPHWPSGWAFGFALSMSLLITLGLVVRGRVSTVRR